MKEIRWDPEKSDTLKRERGLSFDDLLQTRMIEASRIHPNRPHQNLMLFDVGGYIWVVPYIETETEIFMKTLYPSRKYTRLYRQGRLSDENKLEENKTD